MITDNFDQGLATSEREAFPEGPVFDQAGTLRSYVGYGQLERDTRRQAHMDDGELERMATNCLSTAQAQHGLIWEQRGGSSRKQDFPDGTGHGGSRSPSPSGRIKAVQQYGLGPAYAAPGPSGHDPVDSSPPTDHFRQPEPLAKYGAGVFGAQSVLGRGQSFGSGFPTDHRASQMVTMGDSILDGFVQRTGQVTSDEVGPPGQDKGAHLRSNREMGQP